MVFSVHVTWRQLPRYGPSSPKRLEQQGRQFCEPACKKTWGKVKCISLLSIRQPLPNQTCLSTARPHYQEHLQHKLKPFSPEEALSTVACASTTAWVSGHRRLDRAWREQQAAPSTANKYANKCQLVTTPKNQTIQLLTSLAAKSLSISNQGSTSSHICGSSPSNSTDVSRSSAISP